MMLLCEFGERNQPRELQSHSLQGWRTQERSIGMQGERSDSSRTIFSIGIYLTMVIRTI